MTPREIIRSARTIAVVGISDKPDRPSNDVARQLQRRGYTIIPVNPAIKEWNGISVYPRVSAIPENIEIDIVDIFRRSEDTPERRPRCLASCE